MVSMSDLFKPRVALLDYGLGNILCIQRAFEYCDADVTILSKPDKVENFTHVILPGVGAFHSGMNNLKSLGYLDFIRDAVELNLPLMGICLGMQLLFESGTENGYLSGLNLLPGQILKIPTYNKQNHSVKLPHIGWNKLNIILPSDSSSIVDGLSDNTYVYFDHSYYADLMDYQLCVAETEHDTISLPAIVQKNNIIGCQFHPEKSGMAGLTIIRNFLLM